MKLKTVELQDMIVKSIKGASNNKLIPITQMIGIICKNKKLTLITTDATNYMYITSDVESDDFEVTVPIEILAKLVSKMTSEYISLELKESSLEISGNGTYKIELPLDESGELIKYPDPLSEFTDSEAETVEITLETIKSLLNIIKPALATTLEIPCYIGYYIGDRAIGTDTYRFTSIPVTMFKTPVLLNPEMVNMLDVFTEAKFKATLKDDIVVFNSDNACVYGHLLDGIEDYAVATSQQLLDMNFKNVVKLPKDTLIQILDRLSLFVSDYDRGAVRLTFTDKSLQLSSLQSNGIESVDYLSKEKAESFTCEISIDMLLSQLKSQSGDITEVHYGEDNIIKLKNDNVTQILALLTEDDL